MLHVCRLHLAAGTTSTNANVPPTPLLFPTPIHNSLTRRSGPTPSLWNWNPTKTFCCCRATATPSPHSTSSAVASCSEGNFLLLRLGTAEIISQNLTRKGKRNRASLQSLQHCCWRQRQGDYLITTVGVYARQRLFKCHSNYRSHNIFSPDDGVMNFLRGASLQLSPQHKAPSPDVN